MKRRFLLVLAAILAVVPVLTSSSAGQSPQEAYIQRWASVAVSEMYRSGVPASITLAQGLLESGSGLSRLATQGNNHFGIKCHNWKGKSMRANDDLPNECFRVYDTAEQSFQDHSDFLRYWDRYKFLFDLKTTDYKGWAYGLKKAGYATAPNYAQALINLIETYDLSRFDRMTVKEAARTYGKPSSSKGSSKNYTSRSSSKNKKMTARERRAAEKARKEAEKKAAKARKEASRNAAAAQRQAQKDAAKAAREAERQADKAAREAARESARARRNEFWSNLGGEYVDESLTEIPESPLKIEEPKRFDKSGETFSFSLSREMYSRNGVPFIYSVEGETIESIAKANDLFPRELLRFNDLKQGSTLAPGTIVYLQPKKNQGAKDLDRYIIDHDGEDLWAVSQRFGVKLDAIYKMNGIDSSYIPREGDMIVLRRRGAKGE